MGRRLASRIDCRQIEYRVVIEDIEGTYKQKLTLFPNIMIQRGRSRRRSNAMPILEYLNGSIWIASSEYDNEKQTIYLYESLYITGIYLYKLSVSKKRRKWIKLQ